MSILSELEQILKTSAYSTTQLIDATGTEVANTYVAGTVSSTSDLDAVLTGFDYSETDVVLNDGVLFDIYGFEKEMTVVIVNEYNEEIWCHCMQCSSVSDYNLIIQNQTPSAEARV